MNYQDAGVDIDGGDAFVRVITPLAKATATPGVMGSLGGFGAMFDLKPMGFHDPLLVAATDGVGTKLKVAIEAGKHDTIGLDLVAMSVNDLVVHGAAPLFFLDYFATGKLDPSVAIEVVRGIAQGCQTVGCALIGGETAEMPGLYQTGDYDLAGFAVGAVERGERLPDNVRAGDVLIGLASSGVHANGFSLVRHIVTAAGLQWDSPWDAGRTLADVFLTPTHLYVSSVLALHRTGHLHAAAHITGGGLIGNVPRVIPEGLTVRINQPWRVPAEFGWLRKAGLSDEEMLRTFNCGIGMVLVVPPTDVLGALSIGGIILGEVIPGEVPEIVLPDSNWWM